MSKTTNFQPSLDGLRVLSSLGIMALHTHSVLKEFVDRESYEGSMRDDRFFQIINNGLYYVETFFVLTGYLIASSLLSSSKSTGFYYRSRLVRIVPLMVVAALIDLAFPVKGLDRWPDGALWKSVLFVSNMLGVLPEAVDYPPGERMVWTWSVNVQMHFYLLAPILLWVISFVPTRFLKTITPLSLISLVLYYRYAVMIDLDFHHKFPIDFYNPDATFFKFYRLLYEPTQARIGSILVGVFVACVLHYYKDGIKKIVNNTIVAYILLAWGLMFPLMFLSSPPAVEKNQVTPAEVILFALVAGWLLWSWSIGLLMISCLCYDEKKAIFPLRIVNKVLSFKFWEPLSRWSYASYLIHIIVLGQIYQRVEFQSNHPIERHEYLTYFALLNVIVWPVSFLLHEFVEKPVAKLLSPVQKSKTL